jgi:hypothetical protein
MFFPNKLEDIYNVVEMIESDVKEIKETNQFILPESIRYEFHYTYSTNVFMMVKRMQYRELIEMHNFNNYIQKLIRLKTKLDLAKTNGLNDEIRNINKLILSENEKKTKCVESILSCRKEYYELDKQFNAEIKKHMRRVNKWFIFRIICCDWLKS